MPRCKSQLYEKYYPLIEECALDFSFKSGMDFSDLLFSGLDAFQKARNCKYNDEVHFSKLLRICLFQHFIEYTRKYNRRMELLQQEEIAEKLVYKNPQLEGYKKLVFEEKIEALSREAQYLVRSILFNRIHFTGSDTIREMRGKVRRFLSARYTQRKVGMILVELKMTFG